MSLTIAPYRIDIPQAELDDLKRRITETRWPVQSRDTDWSKGVPVDYLRGLADHWADGFDWRAWEKRLNDHPQFVTEIDGARIHFLHVRSPHPDALPLLLAHGWPGSVLEFIDLIEPFTNPPDPADAFDLVIPSHPNFGFSGPAPDAGWDSTRMARAYAVLMAELGYPRFGAQGGDFGAFVAPDLGRAAPERVVGVHVNAATAGFIPFGASEEELAGLSEVDQTRLERLSGFLSDGSGYFQVMATRPNTVGFGVADSPVGQAAWIVEKFKEWTHGEGLPEAKVDRDHMLANITVYWLTNTGASSAHMYWDSMHSGNWPTPSPVPTGVAAFAEDVSIRRFSEGLNNIVRWTDFDTGGHFAAMEVPDLLAADVREFFRPLR